MATILFFPDVLCYEGVVAHFKRIYVIFEEDLTAPVRIIFNDVS